MQSYLDRQPLSGILEELYGKARARTGSALPPGRHEPMSAQERADAAADRYMPVSNRSGRLLYSLAYALKPRIIVEFGMSYGISTLHLAAAVHDSGVGHVYTTEMSAKKIAAAPLTFAAAGLDELITVLPGDALETLRGVPGEIGVVLLDGWKDLYLPVLELIEPRLSRGALILADNADSPGAADYLAHVRDPLNGYTSINFADKEHDSTELTCRL